MSVLYVPRVLDGRTIVYVQRVLDEVLYVPRSELAPALLRGRG